MTPLNFEIGLSSSASSGVGSGHTGDFHPSVSGGGMRQAQTQYIVLGVVAVLALVAWLVLRGGRKRR